MYYLGEKRKYTTLTGVVDLIKIELYEGWYYKKLEGNFSSVPVRLPHDAMLHEGRSDRSAGGVHVSWFQGVDYCYTNNINWSPTSFPFEPKLVLLECEGVYRNAEVYFNDELITRRPYGYTCFYADLSGKLEKGNNTLRVHALNSKQPNSRWYSGSGIFRPVHLLIFPKKHIQVNSVRIKTVNFQQPEINVSGKTEGTGVVQIEIIDVQSAEILWQTESFSDGSFHTKISLPGAILWNPETPRLYNCRLSFDQDIQEVAFGIRMITCNAQEGFRLNGHRIILRGACIHHDNGILGAVAEPFAETRKVRLLKEAGYNALRSAHNPCSKALLEACDQEGMLLMDEYVDMWYIHKTKYDYADDFPQWWRQDLTDMVNKDYNHPCVIMYSIGNEVSETSQQRGIKLTDEMQKHLRTLDDTRPVTCGINLFFNYLSRLGFGVYSDEKANKTENLPDSRKKKVGSEFYNEMAGVLGAKFMKFGATLPGSDKYTKDAYAALDVAGYNYGINRYKRDFRKYKNRVILGTETFCADAYRFWELAKRHSALIGDFVWAGMDYLGEAGIGAWEYKEYAPDFGGGFGWITAGSGRLGITGQSSGEMLYTQVAYEQIPIAMAVVPVSKKRRRHSPSAWKLTNALPSWSWHGMEGAQAMIEVYSRTDRVALYLNNKKIGEKRNKNNCRLLFKATYQPGVLQAKGLDRNGVVVCSTVLRTSNEQTILSLIPELKVLTQKDLAYIQIRYADPTGITQPLARGKIKVQVENGKLLGLGNSCPFNKYGYLNDFTDTYYGEALAVIRPISAGEIVIRAQSPYGEATARVEVK